MKIILWLAVFMVSISAFAAGVKVTSFNYIRSGQYYAEICGLVEESNGDTKFIRIEVDPKENKPAIYNTVAGKDGKFCAVIVTYKGQAEASLFDEAVITKATIEKTSN